MSENQQGSTQTNRSTKHVVDNNIAEEQSRSPRASHDRGQNASVAAANPPAEKQKKDALLLSLRF